MKKRILAFLLALRALPCRCWCCRHRQRAAPTRRLAVHHARTRWTAANGLLWYVVTHDAARYGVLLHLPRGVEGSQGAGGRHLITDLPGFALCP